jgi:hypothetical protein
MAVREVSYWRPEKLRMGRFIILTSHQVRNIGSRMRCAGHVARVGVMKYCRIFVGKHRDHLETKCNWEDSSLLKWNFRRVGGWVQ